MTFAQNSLLSKEHFKYLNKTFEEIFKVATPDQVLDLMNGKSPEEVFSNNTSEDDEKFEVSDEELPF